MIDNFIRNTNVKIIKKVLKGYYQNITFDTEEELMDNYSIYINILANGLILDGINNTLIYKAKIHKINESDFPKEDDPNTDDPSTDNNDTSDRIDDARNNEGMNPTTLTIIIVFSFLGIVLFSVLFFFLYRKYNKKMKLNNESNIFKENSEEIMLKSESE